MSIKAHYRREERYEGMQLVYGTDLAAKEQILNVIEAVKNETKLNPMVVENHDKNNLAKSAIYLEFDETNDREGGDFFERVLRRLNIEKCG